MLYPGPARSGGADKGELHVNPESRRVRYPAYPLADRP